jgi:hypothetical protein
MKRYAAGDWIFIPSADDLLAMGWQFIPEGNDPNRDLVTVGQRDHSWPSRVMRAATGKWNLIRRIDNDCGSVTIHRDNPYERMIKLVDLRLPEQSGSTDEEWADFPWAVCGEAVTLAPAELLVAMGWNDLGDSVSHPFVDNVRIKKSNLGRDDVKLGSFTLSTGKCYVRLTNDNGDMLNDYIRLRFLPVLGVNVPTTDDCEAVIAEYRAKAEAQLTAERAQSVDLADKFMRLAQTSSAVDAARQGLVHVGFELEFHKINEFSSDSDTEYDEDAIEGIISDDWENRLSLRDKVRYVQNDSFRGFLRIIMEYSPAIEIDELRDAALKVSVDCADKLASRFDDEMDDAYDRYRRNRRSDDDWSDYTVDSGSMEDSFCCDYMEQVQLGEDGSVRGGEIRTRGGLSPARFMTIAADIFEKNTFEIDNGCSFHIHISATDVKHSYGNQMQAEMTAYVLSQYHRWPARLRERFKSSSYHYFEVALQSDKYSFVNFNKEYGTWEFRIFGNVTDVREARICLYLAIEALRHAYRVRCKLTPALVTNSAVLYALSKRLRQRKVDVLQNHLKILRSALRQVNSGANYVRLPVNSDNDAFDEYRNEEIRIPEISVRAAA